MTDNTKSLADAAKAAEVNWDKLNPQVVYQGKHIIIPGEPAQMPLPKAIETLHRMQADEEQEFDVHEYIEAFPHDGAVAFLKAMMREYGWASPVSVRTFFGNRPPQMTTIKTGPGVDDVVQCPLGRFKLPGVDYPIETGFDTDHNGTPCFAIWGTVRKKHRHLILALANAARKIVREESIYRGKALRLHVSEEGYLDMQQPPEFLDVSSATAENLMFDDDIMQQLHDSVLVPIMHTDACRKLRIPLKRGVLFQGKYGTGKTLMARRVANVAQQHGWTYFLIDNVRGLRPALEIMRDRYAPGIVFAEDVDRIAGERDEQLNDLVNIIDGVVSKDAEVMTILTTNHVERIEQVMLRQGRLDVMIEMRPPNALTVQKLLRHYARGLLPNSVDLSEAGQALEGQIPASIRECVERAKLGMIGRGDTVLSAKDLAVSAATMRLHLDMLNRDKGQELSAEHRLGAALAELLQPTSTRVQIKSDQAFMPADRKALSSVRNMVGDIAENILNS